jgi:hypothetical protein
VTASIQEEKWGPRVVVGLLHTLLLKSGRPRPLTISLPLWAILTGGKDTFPDIRFAAGRVRSSVPFARVAPHFELALGISDARSHTSDFDILRFPCETHERAPRSCERHAHMGDKSQKKTKKHAHTT